MDVWLVGASGAPAPLSRDLVIVRRSKILSSSEPGPRISNLSTMNDSFEELPAQNILSEEIPSEMEVAPCYKLLVHCLQREYYSNCFARLKQQHVCLF